MFVHVKLVKKNPIPSPPSPSPGCIGA